MTVVKISLFRFLFHGNVGILAKFTLNQQKNQSSMLQVGKVKRFHNNIFIDPSNILRSCLKMRGNIIATRNEDTVPS